MKIFITIADIQMSSTQQEESSKKEKGSITIKICSRRLDSTNQQNKLQ